MSSIEEYWANKVKVAKVTEDNLQNELEYLEDNIGAGNISSFIGLEDTPNAYNASKILNSNQSSISFSSYNIELLANISTNMNNISSNDVDIDNLSSLQDDYLLLDGSQAMTGDLNVGYHNITNTGELEFDNNAGGYAEKVSIKDGLEFWVDASHRFDILSTYAIGMFDDLGMGSHDIKKVHELIMNDACSIKPEGNTGNKYFFLKGYDDTEFAQVGNLYLHLSDVKLKNSMDANSQNIINIPTPTLDHHAANKSYADKIKGRTVDDAAIGDDKILVYKTTGSKHVYETKPSGSGGDATLVVAATDAPTAIKNRADYVCDGTSDETEINTALGVADSVILTVGTFTIDGQISIDTLQSLIGQGGSTIIKLKNAHNGNLSMVKLYNASGCYRGYIGNLVIDGNKAQQSSGVQYGLHFSNTDYCVGENLWIMNCRSRGVLFDTAGWVTQLLKSHVISNDYGIYIDTGPYIKILHCFVNENEDHGIYQSSGEELNEIASCDVRRNAKHGIYVQGTDMQIHDNTVVDSSTAAHEAFSNIHVVGNDHHVQNNKCRVGSQANKPLAGIRIASGATNNIIDGNDCKNGGNSHGIGDAGTTTCFGGGNRNKDGTWSTTPN